jgi:hypothetical protein
VKLRRLFLSGLLVVAAASLARELVTRDGVGPFEYVAGVAVVALLAVAAFRSSVRALRRA